MDIFQKIKSSILMKLGLLSCLMAFLAIASVIYTVRTLHSLEDVSRAIDISGSERMRSILLGSLLNEYVKEVEKNQGNLTEHALRLKYLISEELNTYEEYLVGLGEGSKTLGLAKVDDEYIIDRLELLKRGFFEWKKIIKKAIRPKSTKIDREKAAAKLSAENAVYLKQTAHKLARRTSKFTGDIIMVLENIRKELLDITKIMNDGTSLVENTGNFLTAITEDISNTADQVNLISSATTHQVDISRKIADSLIFISGISRQTSNNSKESAEETNKLATLAEQLKTITNKFQINSNV